jgi:hypothetical protein
VKRAFWDAFVFRLDEGHVEQLDLIVDEVKHKLKALTPSRTDIHQQIHLFIDTKLIVQMVKHQCMDNTHLLQWTSFIVDHIQKMQAPQHNSSTQAWYNTWKHNLQMSNHQDMSRMFARFLQHVHDDLDIILHDKHVFEHLKNC